MSVEKRSISAEAALFAQADARALRLRYKKFSHYVQALIESDIHYAGKQSDFMHNRPLPPDDAVNSIKEYPRVEKAFQAILNDAVAAPVPAPSPAAAPRRKVPRTKVPPK